MSETTKNYIPDEILDIADDPKSAFGLMALEGLWNEPAQNPNVFVNMSPSQEITTPEYQAIEKPVDK